MRYYFQRPPKNFTKVFKLEEDETNQCLKVEIYNKTCIDNEVIKELVGSKTLFINDTFVPNYYTLVPIKNSQLMTPINMVEKLKKRQTLEVLEKADRFGDYAFALIFGENPLINCTSIVAFYDFYFKNEQIANNGKDMTFHDMIEMSVDDKKKVLLEKEILKLDINTQSILAGIGSQLELLSHITIKLIEKMANIAPNIICELEKETELKEFCNILNATGGKSKDFENHLCDMQQQKKKLENEKMVFKQLISRAK